MAEEKKKEEKVYVIPTQTRGVSASRRTSSAVKMIRGYVLKHSKASKAKIDGKINKLYWARGMSNPPTRVKVKVTVEDGTAVASLVE